jgi:FtsZ-interacting cell division protein ZipA
MWPSVSVEQAFRAWLRWVGQRLQFKRTAQLRRVLLEERQRQRQLAAVQRYIDQHMRDGADEQLRLDIPAILAADPDLQRRDPVEDELALEAQQPESSEGSEDEEADALPTRRSADKNKIALIHALRKQRHAERQLQKVWNSKAIHFVMFH